MTGGRSTPRSNSSSGSDQTARPHPGSSLYNDPKDSDNFLRTDTLVGMIDASLQMAEEDLLTILAHMYGESAIEAVESDFQYLRYDLESIQRDLAAASDRPDQYAPDSAWLDAAQRRSRLLQHKWKKYVDLNHKVNAELQEYYQQRTVEDQVSHGSIFRAARHLRDMGWMQVLQDEIGSPKVEELKEMRKWARDFRAEVEARKEAGRKARRAKAEQEKERGREKPKPLDRRAEGSEFGEGSSLQTTLPQRPKSSERSQSPGVGTSKPPASSVSASTSSSQHKKPSSGKTGSGSSGSSAGSGNSGSKSQNHKRRSGAEPGSGSGS